MKKIFLAAIGLMVFTRGIMAVPAPIATIHLQEPRTVVADVVRLAEFIGEPIPPEMLYAQLGNLLMVGPLNGVDLAQPFEVVIAEEDGEEVMISRFAVEGDGSAYLEEVGKRLPVREVVSKSVVAFKPTGTSPEHLFFVKLGDGRAVTGSKLAHVEALDVPITENERAALALTGRGVTVLLAPAVLRETLEAELAGAREAIGEASEDAVAMIDLYSTISEKVLANLDVLALNLDIHQDLTLRVHIQAKEGSRLAGILSAMVPPSAVVSAYTDERALMNTFGTMAGLQQIMGPYADWVAELYRSMGPPMDAFADSYRDMILAMNEVYQGGYNVVLLPPSATDLLQMAGLYEVKHVDEARDAIQRMMQVQMEQLASVSEAPFKVAATNAMISTYQDIEITTYTTALNMQPGSTAKMPTPLIGLFTNFTYHMAFVDTYLVYAVGDVMHAHRLIDFIKAGPPPARDLPAFADVTGEQVGYWDVDLGRLVATGMSLFGAPPDETMKAGLRGLTVKEANGLTTMMRLTREDLETIKSFVESLMASRSGAGMPPPEDDGFRLDEAYELEELPFEMEEP